MQTSALGIESSLKNINLAVLIAASLFGIKGQNGEFGAGVLFVLLRYGGVSRAVAAVPMRANLRQLRKAGSYKGAEEMDVQT